MTLAAGLTLILANTLGSVPFASLAPESIRAYAPRLGAASGAGVSFLLGISAAGAAAALLMIDATDAGVSL